MPPPYKCLIAEDNLLDRDAAEMYLTKIDTLQIEAVCGSGTEAAAILQQKPIDIVFSDIDMPGMSGMELIKNLLHPPVFIFISSHPEHAAESYSLDVIDFIVKPVTFARLTKATSKAIEYIELKKIAASGAEIPQALLPQSALVNTGTVQISDHFFIKENADFSRIETAGLLYVESMGNFSKLHTQLRKHLTLVSLKNIESQLPASDFIRIHKQYIINLRHMVSLSSEGEVQLSSGHTLPVGDMYKAALLNIVHKRVLLR